jgi:type III pantothenate kinase
MILVDIGNSGLRGVAINDTSASGDRDFWNRPTVIKLSWSAIGKQIQKARPLLQESATERWTDRDDASGLRWFVSQFPKDPAQTWRIASVNRSAHQQLLAILEETQPGVIARSITYRDIPMDTSVDFPDQLGIDRLLAARGAWAWFNQGAKDPTPIVVVQAGTAITIDWIDAQGCFCGGAILPGVGLSLQYLAAGTDQLPWIPSQTVKSYPALPGKNTEQAIAAGVHASVVGGATFLIARYRKTEPIPVFVSGGDGRLLRDLIPPPVVFVDHLVLYGLSLPLVDDPVLGNS